MAFFPLVSILDTKGYCTVYNFPPNNWEKTDSGDKTVWAIYSDGHKWNTKSLGVLKSGESKTFYYDDLKISRPVGTSKLVVLQLRKTPLLSHLNQLPDHEIVFNKVPEWRASVGFSLNNAQTSYQGEINPFPPAASLLTFHPFIQFKKTLNYFVFINLEKSPLIRIARIEIYKSSTKEFVDQVEVKSCHANIIPLDQYGFSEDELPVFICRNMAGIPFGFGVAEDKTMLSLEHTHPPASFAVHGERFKVQNNIKKQWFNELIVKE